MTTTNKEPIKYLAILKPLSDKSKISNPQGDGGKKEKYAQSYNKLRSPPPDAENLLQKSKEDNPKANAVKLVSKTHGQRLPLLPFT